MAGVVGRNLLALATDDEVRALIVALPQRVERGADPAKCVSATGNERRVRAVC